MKSDYFGSVEVKHRDWLDSAIKDHRKTFDIIESDRLPHVLTGSFVVTMCLRLLRCVYGSDLDSLHALNQIIMAQEQENAEQSELQRHVQHCRDTDCQQCAKYRQQREALCAELGITPEDLAETADLWDGKEH